MDRLVLLFACVAQIGCQSPTTSYNPFGPRQTRVPSPHTGVVGGDGYYSSPAPADGAYIPPLRGAGEQVTGVGPWRYWESAKEKRGPSSNLQAVRSNLPQNERTPSYGSNRNAGLNNVKQARGSVASDTSRPYPVANLKKNDRLQWKEPQFASSYGESYQGSTYSTTPYSGSSYSEIAQQQLPVGVPMNQTPVGSGYPPNLLPQPGPVGQLTSRPVRIRSFPNSYSRQAVGIPVELAEYQTNGVRQASATAPDWQRRYDDVRR